MAEAEKIYISGAVEGPTDEAVLTRLFEYLGASPATIYGKRGKPFLKTRLPSYNCAANYAPWVILVDLDNDADCVPPFRKDWLPNPAPRMCFRVAVRQVEAWLIADRERLARYLSVPASKIPRNPEGIENAKLVMVRLARQSSRREIRSGMVPSAGSGRQVGPTYMSHLIQFATDVRNGWRPEVAAESSDSLRRCIGCIRRLVREGSGFGNG